MEKEMILSRLVASFWRDEFRVSSIGINRQRYALLNVRDDLNDLFDPPLPIYEPASKDKVVECLYDVSDPGEDRDPVADAWMASEKHIVVEEAVVEVSADRPDLSGPG